MERFGTGCENKFTPDRKTDNKTTKSIDIFFMVFSLLFFNQLNYIANLILLEGLTIK